MSRLEATGRVAVEIRQGQFVRRPDGSLAEFTQAQAEAWIEQARARYVSPLGPRQGSIIPIHRREVDE